MRVGLAVSLALLVGWVVLTVVLDDEPALEPLGALFGFGIIAFGLIVQFGGRCPRCRRRVVPRAMLEIPPRCPSCGVGFRR